MSHDTGPKGWYAKGPAVRSLNGAEATLTHTEPLPRKLDLRYTGHTMARRFVLILLAVMTFQFTWNVVSAYCMHESGRASNHFGHHQHNSSADELSLAAKDKSPLSKKLTAHDAHCAYVHIALAAPDLAESCFKMENASDAVATALVSPDSIVPSPPYRPKWTGRA